MLEKIKQYKWLAAVAIGVAAAADFAFGLGVSEYVLAFFASAPVAP